LRGKNKIMVDMMVDNGVSRREVSYQCENQECEAFFKGTKGKTLVVQAGGSRDDAHFELIEQRRNEQFQRPSEVPTQSTPNGLRCTEVRYGRKVGLPDYGSECIELVVVLEPGQKASDALAYAKQFVDSRLTKTENRRQ
jgi:hypothetical protein